VFGQASCTDEYETDNGHFAPEAQFCRHTDSFQVLQMVIGISNGGQVSCLCVTQEVETTCSTVLWEQPVPIVY
jgi:hypothetical protein